MSSSFSSSSSSSLKKRSGLTRGATGLESDAKKHVSSSRAQLEPPSSLTSLFGEGLVDHPASSSVFSSSMAFAPSTCLEDKIAKTFQTIFGPDALKDADQMSLPYQAQVLFLLHTMGGYTKPGTVTFCLEDEALFLKGPNRHELQDFLVKAGVKPVSFEVMDLDAIEAEAEKNGVSGSMLKTLNGYKKQPYEFQVKSDSNNSQQKSLPKISFLTRASGTKNLPLAEIALQAEYYAIRRVSVSQVNFFALCVNGQAVGLESISIDHCDPWSSISRRLLEYNTFLENAPDKVAQYLQDLHKKHFKGFFVKGSNKRDVCSVYLATCLYNDLTNLSYLVCRENSSKNNKPFEEWLADIKKGDFLWTYIRNVITKDEDAKCKEVLNQDRGAFIDFMRTNRLDTSGFIYRYRKSSAPADEPGIGFGMFMRSVLRKIELPDIILNSNRHHVRSNTVCQMLQGNLDTGLQHLDTLEKNSSAFEELQGQLEKAKESFGKYKDYLKTGTSTKYARGMTVNTMRISLQPAFESGVPFAEELWKEDFDTSDCSDTEEKIYPQEVKTIRKSHAEIDSIRRKKHE